MTTRYTYTAVLFDSKKVTFLIVIVLTVKFSPVTETGSAATKLTKQNSNSRSSHSKDSVLKFTHTTSRTRRNSSKSLGELRLFLTPSTNSEISWIISDQSKISPNILDESKISWATLDGNRIFLDVLDRAENKPEGLCPQECKCDTNLTYADCSQQFGRLKHIPQLPLSIRYLNFSFNNLTSINDTHFFQNVTQLQGLDISNNGLNYVKPGSFTAVTKLQGLFLSYNNLNYSSLAFVFEVPSLIFLEMIHLIPALGPIPEGWFSQRRQIKALETLVLHDNSLGDVNLKVFRPLCKLKRLGVGYNEVYHLYSDYMPSLEHLILHTNRLYDFPVTCDWHNKSFFPRLREMYLNANSISSMKLTVCLPGLQFLDLSRNSFVELLPWSFSSRNQRFPRLEWLRIRYNTVRLKKIHRFAFASESLQLVSLLENQLNFSSESTVHPDAFAGCPKLRILQLQNNNFRGISDEKFQHLFSRNVPSLQHLSLSYCQMSSITTFTFNGLANLTILYLNQNAFLSIPNGAFDSLISLKLLLLNDNLVSYIGSATFNARLRQQLDSLALNGNMFTCDCNVLWFQAWLASNYSLFHPPYVYSEYSCANLPGIDLMHFYLAPQSCLLPHQDYIFVVVALTLMFAAMTLAVTLYRYRWHIKLLLYEGSNGSVERRRLYQEGAGWRYDLYVSYADEDVMWVRQHLMPRLEATGLRLCVRDRDFPPNKPEIHSIERCLEASKKMMFVFSASYGRDEMKTFEVTLCLRHALDHGDRPLVACLYDIPSRDMTIDMMAVMKTCPYMLWNEDDDVIASFWGRLLLSMSEVMSSRPVEIVS
uniref:Toll-like recptor 16 n=1 Tax=Oncomelania hupensis TaxID=56141 RepID=A0A2H4HI02_9CAEN|nr:toll-like recptor 16 [Oncomelania hupensis]